MFHVKQFDTSPPPPLLPPLSPRDFAAATGATPETLARLEIYVDLLLKWQKRINLVGRGTLDDVWRRHLLDSAQLLPLLPAVTTDVASTVVLDMGCGAGFPGLVLAIMGGCTVHLVESDSRKCAFLFEVLAQTGVRNVHLHNVRMETLAPFAVDVVTSRALASLDKLLDMAEPFLATQTRCLFLKGQKAQEELTETLKTRTMDVVMIQSQTDPSGTILNLSTIERSP